MEVIAPWFCFAPGHQSPPLAMVGYNKNIFCFIKNIFLHKGGGHCTMVVVLLVTTRSLPSPPRLANCFLVLNYHCCCIFSDLQAQSWLVGAWNPAFLWICVLFKFSVAILPFSKKYSFMHELSSYQIYLNCKWKCNDGQETPASCHITWRLLIKDTCSGELLWMNVMLMKLGVRTTSTRHYASEAAAGWGLL